MTGVVSPRARMVWVTSKPSMSSSSTSIRIKSNCPASSAARACAPLAATEGSSSLLLSLYIGKLLRKQRRDSREISEATDKAKEVVRQISAMSRKNVETVYKCIPAKKALERTIQAASVLSIEANELWRQLMPMQAAGIVMAVAITVFWGFMEKERIAATRGRGF